MQEAIEIVSFLLSRIAARDEQLKQQQATINDLTAKLQAATQVTAEK